MSIDEQFVEKKRLEFFAFRRALTNESDRGCALFAAAYLESSLGDLFRASMLEGRKIEMDLFEGASPLASFSARIKMAYYLGYISDAFRTDLDLIRKIRNEFAHNPTVVTFDDQSLSDRCRQLGFSYHDPSARPRAHFTAAASGLLASIHMLTIKANRPQPKPDDRPTEQDKKLAQKRASEAVEIKKNTFERSQRGGDDQETSN